MVIWGSFLFWRIIVALIGAFATAYLHEIKGRNVQMGGLIGLAVGGIGGLFFLLWLWVWLYYFSSSPIGRVYYGKAFAPLVPMVELTPEQAESAV